MNQICMPAKIYIADSDPAITPLAKQLIDLVERGLKWAEARIKLPTLDIVVIRNPMFVIPETGVSGYAPTSNLVVLSVDPLNSNFAAKMDVELPATIVHELHHCSRWSGPDYGHTLLKALVSEGLAQHFEADFRQGAAPFYAEMLSDADVNRLLAQASEEFDDPSYSHSDWFFGSDSRNIPRHTGYSLGFQLVGRFLRERQGNAAYYNLEPSDSFRPQL
jgi:uncharacterized protein YjaZ